MRWLRKLFGLNIKTKLLLLFCATILLPLIMITQIFITISVQKIQEQAVSIARGSVDQNLINVRSLLERYTNICNRYSYNEKLLTTLSLEERYEDPYTSYQAYNLISNIILNDALTLDFQVFMKIYYLNANLSQDIVNFIQVDKQIENSEMFQQTVEADGQIVWRYEDEKFSLSKVIKDYNGVLLGIIYLDLPLSEIRSLIGKHNPDEMNVMIFDSVGNVVTSNNQSLEGANVSQEFYFTARDGLELLYDNDGEYLYSPGNFKSMNNSLPDWDMITLIPMNQILLESSQMKQKVLLICLITLFISSIVFFSFLDRITKRIRSLVKRMKIVGEGNFHMVESQDSNDEIGVIIRNFNMMTVSLNNLFYENVETKLQLKDITIKKREAELHALQSQIHPHFLFNTLESIRMKLQKNNQDAANMILNLSKILRNSLNWKSDIITLSEEIDLVRSYLEIQRYRFKEKLQYHIEVPDELLSYMIPKLIIQPLVENAIKHGIEKKWGGGTVTISISIKEEYLYIHVEDNGAGMDARTVDHIRNNLQSKSTMTNYRIGIKNVYDRISLHCGTDSHLDIQSSIDEWTKVTIALFTNNGKKTS